MFSTTQTSYLSNALIICIVLLFSPQVEHQYIFLITSAQILLISNILFVGRLHVGYNFLFLMGFTYYLLFFPLLYSLGYADIDVYSYDLFLKGSLVSFFSLFFYCLGYFLFSLISTKQNFIPTAPHEQFDTKMVFFTSLFIAAAVYLVMGVTYIHLPSVLLTIFLVLFVLQPKKEFSLKRFIILSLFFIVISTLITTGRRDLIKIFIICLVFLSFTNFNLKLRTLFSIFSAATFTLVFITFNRTRTGYGLSYEDTYDILLKNFANAENTIWFFLVNADFSVAYDNYLYLLNKVNLTGELFGSTLMKFLVFFIPRQVWHDKPLDAQQLIIDEQINYTFASGTSQSMNFLGELYWNFGLFGAFVGFFLIGFLVKTSQAVSENSSKYLIATFLIFSPCIFLMWRGAISTTFIDSILSFIFITLSFTFAVILTNLLPKKTKNNV